MKPNIITIIGTGMSGLTQAASLAHQGFPVTLIGPRQSIVNDDRTTAILNPGIELLKKLNVWDDIAPHATPLQTMELVNESNVYLFDAAEVEADQFGFNVPNMLLKRALTQQLHEHPDVIWHRQNAIHLQHDSDGWTITLEDGTQHPLSLLIAADGTNSVTRQAAQIGTDMRSENQSALVATLEVAKPHHNTSVEWYFNGGPMTLVPMPNNKLALVWCDHADIQKERLKKSKAILSLELTELTNHRFGQLKITDDLQLWPIRPMKAHKLVAPHTALIGESAHVLAPIGAQGFNLSLQDIMALTHVLVQGRALGLAVHDPVMLQAYEKKRLTDIIWRYRGINTLNDLIRTTSIPGRFIRRLSMSGIIRHTVLKRFLMQIGMGQAA